jgi:hypothetical protein
LADFAYSIRNKIASFSEIEQLVLCSNLCMLNISANPFEELAKGDDFSMTVTFFKQVTSLLPNLRNLNGSMITPQESTLNEIQKAS